MIDSAADNNGNNNSASVNKIGKSGKKQYNEVIHCQPRKIFPLGNERNEDMIYPNVIYHYSVSTDARYVYVIGEDSRESQSQLFVWDLHRGSACRYAVVDLPWPLQIKHLYEIDYFEGILVCCSPTAFHIHAVRIDHSKHIIQLERILFYELNINSHFWSSARATERGIILMSQHSQIGHFYVAHIGLDTPVRSVFLKTRMYGLRFCGQPWVDGNYVYLFESSSITTYTEIKYLTGRLVRANLHTGELEIVRTEAADNIRNSLPAIYHQQQQQEQQQQQLEEELPQDYMRGITTLIRRMKHVGRDGWLWIIAEFVEPYDPLNQNAARCEVCLHVLSFKLFTQKKFSCSYESGEYAHYLHERCK
uniref:WD_REPEATS_REGION domain-containing protein n=1 Tax=Elaeophora elaphi TaxID=1147741 RepID=A0A0R3S7F6_9BILA